MPKKIAVLVSGQGTNAKNIHEYFNSKYGHGISAIISSRTNDDLKSWAYSRNIPYIQTDDKLYVDNIPLREIPEIQLADIVVLAGFLKKIPQDFIQKITVPIINIHPSLLPKYGGKGMYGSKVHQAVISSGDKFSGITIHHVNENYDEGKIVLQDKIAISDDETIESLASKIHALEYKHYPEVIDELIYS